MNGIPDYLTSPADAGTLARLRLRLERAAEADGLLDVAYTTVDSPVGPLLLAATPQGLVRVAYDVEDHDRVLDVLARRLSPRVLRAPGRLATAARELDEYFGGRRREFDLPLDMSLSKGFRQLVQRHLPEIGYGQTRTYGQVAALVSILPTPPILFDVHRNGQNIPAVGVGSKTAHFFILNRETGEPIFGVEERPVAQTDVPGEVTSATQPFPVAPRALSPQTKLTADNVWGATDADLKWCQRRSGQATLGGRVYSTQFARIYPAARQHRRHGVGRRSLRSRQPPADHSHQQFSNGGFPDPSCRLRS